MSGGVAKREPNFIAFIDEAGDPGLKKVAPLDPNGASEWFVMSAVVVRASRDSEIVDWVRDLRRSINALQGPALHYRNLSPTKALAACEFLAGKPLRVFTVASNKLNMRGHRNIRAEKAGGQEWFYNWITRLLLERVTEYCYRRSISEFKHPGMLRLEFSKRGGVRYSQMMAYHKYLEMQANTPAGPVLSVRLPRFEVMNWDHFHVFPHHQRAGLQLADVAASAFYQAADSRSSSWTVGPASALAPVVAKHAKRAINVGLTLWPLPSHGRTLTGEQSVIFRQFGYTFPEEGGGPRPSVRP